MKVSLDNVSLDIQPEELAQLWALLKGGNIALPSQQFHTLPPLDLPPPPPAAQTVEFQEVAQEEVFEPIPPPPPIHPIHEPVINPPAPLPVEHFPQLSLEYEMPHPVGEAILRIWVVIWHFMDRLSESKVFYSVVVALLLLAIASRVIKARGNIEPEPTATPSPALVEPAATPTAAPTPAADPEDSPIPVPAAPIPEGAM